jgi:hypothetical protein
MWNEMCNFVSDIVRGKVRQPEISTSVYDTHFVKMLQRDEPSAPIEKVEKEEREEEKPFLITLRVLLFNGMFRKRKLVTIQDETNYNQVRDEAAVLLGIKNAKECVFLQATDDYGFWYHYGHGLNKGICMGRVQQSGLFFHHDEDWLNLEDVIEKYSLMMNKNEDDEDVVDHGQKRGRSFEKEEEKLDQSETETKVGEKLNETTRRSSKRNANKRVNYKELIL